MYSLRRKSGNKYIFWNCNSSGSKYKFGKSDTNDRWEEAINKLAPVTKPLLPAIDPTKEKKEAKDPEDHKDRTVISTRRGRI